MLARFEELCGRRESFLQFWSKRLVSHSIWCLGWQGGRFGIRWCRHQFFALSFFAEFGKSDNSPIGSLCQYADGSHELAAYLRRIIMGRALARSHEVHVPYKDHLLSHNGQHYNQFRRDPTWVKISKGCHASEINRPLCRIYFFPEYQ
jgi:hypothetical protein